MHVLSFTIFVLSAARAIEEQNATFDVIAANATLHLAWAAYCNETALRAWSCEWCRSPAAPQGVRVSAFLKDAHAGTQGYVAFDANRTRIIVAYRGSHDLANTLQDMEFWMTRPGFGPAQAMVDHGFYGAYLSLRNATAVAIGDARAACPSCEMLFTGHSLGGAMATLAAAEHADGAAPVQLFTFGSPRVGDSAFVRWATARLAQHNVTAYRMRRVRDIVPAIPPRSIG